MKYIFYEDDITIFIYKNIEEKLNDKDNIEEYIKNILINIKKTYKKKISGYYIINIYQNKNYGVILEIKKEEDFDFFPDVVDIKVEIEEESEIYLEVEDYFLINKITDKIYIHDNNYYVNIEDINKKDILNLSEFYKIVYGKELDKIRDKLKQLITL